MDSINIECIKKKGGGFSYNRTYTWLESEARKSLFKRSLPPQYVCDFEKSLKRNSIHYVVKQQQNNRYGTTSYSAHYTIDVSEYYSCSIFKKFQYSKNVFIDKSNITCFTEADRFCKSIIATRQNDLQVLAHSFERGASCITYCEITNYDNIGHSFSSLKLKNLETDAERLGLAFALVSFVSNNSESRFYLIKLYDNSHVDVAKYNYSTDVVLENW